MALEGLSPVEGLNINWWEGELCHRVYAGSRLQIHLIQLALIEPAVQQCQKEVVL